MKKLLVITFILLFAIGASAQDRPDMLFFVGTVDGTALTVGINKMVPIDVWYQATVNDPPVEGADLCFPLGINNHYADAFGDPLDFDLYYPLVPDGTHPIGWDVAAFQSPVENYYNDGTYDWDSYSFQGFADAVMPYGNNPYMDETAFPVKIMTWLIHTVDDASLVPGTYTDAMRPGEDPISGPPNCGDPEGGNGYDCIITYSPFFFSPNQGVEIVPIDEVPADICTFEEAAFHFDVIDPDGDPVVVTTTLGTLEFLGSEADPDPLSDAVTYHYAVTFTQEEFCGECVDGDIVITAYDYATDPEIPNNDPVTLEAGHASFIGVVTASMNDALWIWPGETEMMDVYLDVCADCFCLGGFVFTIEYDISVMDVPQDVAIVPNPILATGDFWYVNYDVAGPGTFRVTFINSLNDQNPNQEICGLIEDPLFSFPITLNPNVDYPPGIDFCIPVCFMYDTDGEDHYLFNNVSDPSGLNVWFNDGCDTPPDSTQNATLELDMLCGNVKVFSEHVLMQGDVNLNGYPMEIGDAVTLANYLGDPNNTEFSTRQYYSSDANGDGAYATVADLIFIINAAIGNGTAKVVPMDVVAALSMPDVVSGNLRVTASCDASIGGAVVTINHTGVELGTPVAEGMDVQYSDNGDVMTVLVYSMEGTSYAAGTNVLFTVPVAGEGAVSFGDVSVADNRGALLDARTNVTAPIPTQFSVSQNYPNPFNAKTSIAFGLPTDNDVTINIYNVAGQLVESMDLGHMFAGTHSVVWDASDVASGVYFYKVSAGSFNETMKMTLLK